MMNKIIHNFFNCDQMTTLNEKSITSQRELVRHYSYTERIHNYFRATYKDYLSLYVLLFLSLFIPLSTASLPSISSSPSIYLLILITISYSSISSTLSFICISILLSLSLSLFTPVTIFIPLSPYFFISIYSSLFT